jgi:RNA polymerase sigma-70 factor (ECF subfamily)
MAGLTALRVERCQPRSGGAATGDLASRLVKDSELVAGLQAGDESAFVELVTLYQARLVRFAEATVGSRAVAEEVTQDTWLAVVRGVERFEGRSSLQTWLFRIMLNRARSAVGREQRAGRPDDTVEERFDASGAWATPPVPWSDQVDDRMVAEDLAARVQVLLPELPEHQREVVILRDVDGVSAEDVASLLGISDGNQRVLLHRGRAKLRALLANELGGAG